MEFQSNGTNEIHFVDGAEHSLLDWHKEALTSAAAHFLDCFRIEHEVDVYVSRRSVLHAMSSNSRAWHMPPTLPRGSAAVRAYSSNTGTAAEFAQNNFRLNTRPRTLTLSSFIICCTTGSWKVFAVAAKKLSVESNQVVIT